MKIYTRTGDDGNTSLAGGQRVPKFHPRIEAYGSVDELISWIGLLRDTPGNESRKKILIYIEHQLMKCASGLANAADDSKLAELLPDMDCTSVVEEEIDRMEARLTPIKTFILPGGHILVSYCHIARCVCRRAERSVLRLNSTENIPDIIFKFLNRLSDYLFVLSRLVSLELDVEEIS
ncbi:MAG TPA: cob(I)yrinic acid a,c-diamide adenosyltransferase [Bacteroidales bacterium]|jgi:cob(I)alamin adenosyltransferase|nr:cob(I)yrinic acid a,c-diamide adenosyltransferase [Bacteroidales bacterium]